MASLAATQTDESTPGEAPATGFAVTLHMSPVASARM